VALHNIKLRKMRGGFSGKTGLAGDAIAKRRVDRQRFPACGILPLAGNQRDIQRRILRQRSAHGDKTLCTTVGVVSLSDNRQLHAGYSSSMYQWRSAPVAG
jgi:hypothetical protein